MLVVIAQAASVVGDNYLRDSGATTNASLSLEINLTATARNHEAHIHKKHSATHAYLQEPSRFNQYPFGPQEAELALINGTDLGAHKDRRHVLLAIVDRKTLEPLTVFVRTLLARRPCIRARPPARA
jgi:hypothetical protein